MASSLARCLSISRNMRVPHRVASRLSSKCLSTSSPILEGPKSDRVEPEARRTNSLIEDDLEEVWEHFEDSADEMDTTSAGHLILQNQRQMLHYMRLIEHELPKLVAFRKDFVPPPEDKALIVRSVHYQGEVHPASRKRVIVAPVDKLSLKDEKAVHNFILLAGPRWSPVPHTDAGVSGHDTWGNGYIKISCEHFPEPSQNLKWASDTLDKLVEEANNSENDFSDIPIDMRHLTAKARKAKKGDHRGNRTFLRTTIHDFPDEWLPRNLQRFYNP